MRQIIYIIILLLLGCSEQNTEEWIAPSTFGSLATLDIITWNVENFPKSNRTVDYMYDIISDINVDVIALQEIENQQSFDVLSSLLDSGWYGYRAENTDWGELSYLINTNNVTITQFPYTILDTYDHWFAYRPPYVVKISYNNEEFILSVTDKGYGKRSSAYEYRVTKRGGVGIANMQLTDRNGNEVVASFPIKENNQLMLVTDKGKLIRCPVSDIRVAGRQTQGVTLFNVSNDEKVVSIAKLEESDD